MKKECYIIGAGTYGQIYAEYIKSTYNVIGFIDDDKSLINTLVNNIRVIGDTKYLFDKINRDTNIFVPIGNNTVRVFLLKKLQEENFLIPSFIHPYSCIHETVKIGKGVYVLPGVNIMPLTTLGDFTMISMGVNIAHHNTIEEGCFFSQGTNIGASILIKEQAYFGISSTAMTGIRQVGKNTLIGAGSVVIKDVPDNAVVAGVPAKILRYK